MGQRGRPRGSKYEYALYKGEEFLDIGTAVFLANKFGLKEKTIRWLAFCRRKERYISQRRICCSAIRGGN